MLIAAVDTATLTLSCALAELRGGEAALLTDRTEPTLPGAAGRLGGHSARLPGALVELLDALGRRITDVEGYAVGLGPGSFTGLRIGLATFKGLAYANRRPVVGASSLAAMALEAAPDAPEGALLVPLLDARKGELYAGFYRRAGGGVQLVAPEVALPAEGLLERLAAPPDGLAPHAFGEGYEAYADRLGAALPRLATGVRTPSAGAVARLCAAALAGAAFDGQRLAALEPHYVRASEAEVKFPNGLPPGPPAGRAP